MIRLFELIKLYFTDRDYYQQRKRYRARQKKARKELKKQTKEFCPWSGYYMHKMICTMLDFYYKTYEAQDCCWSDSACSGKIAASLKEAIDAANALDDIEDLDYKELIALAKKDGVAFTNFVNKWKEQFDNPILEGPHSIELLSGVAHSYLEKKYTKKMYTAIGDHIWEWCD